MINRDTSVITPEERRELREKYRTESALSLVVGTTKSNTVLEVTDQVAAGVATKADSGKTNWSLMPFEAVEEICKVLEFGALKYDAHNWKRGQGLGVVRVLNSCLRHIFAYMRGEKVDPESGLSHLSHAACNLLFAITYSADKEKYLQDGVNEKNT